MINFDQGESVIYNDFALTCTVSCSKLHVIWPFYDNGDDDACDYGNDEYNDDNDGGDDYCDNNDVMMMMMMMMLMMTVITTCFTEAPVSESHLIINTSHEISSLAVHPSPKPASPTDADF